MRKLDAAGAIVGIALSFGLSAAHAEDRLDTPAFKKCMDDAGGVTVSMHNCLATENAQQDKALNETYRVLMASTADQARKMELRDAEREWIRRTKDKCVTQVLKELGGGSEGPIGIDGCYLSEIEAQTLHLRALVAGR